MWSSSEGWPDARMLLTCEKSRVPVNFFLPMSCSTPSLYDQMWTTEPPKMWGSKLRNRLLQSFLLRSTFLAKKGTRDCLCHCGFALKRIFKHRVNKWFEATFETQWPNTNLKQSPAKFSVSPPFLLNFSAQPASNLRAP